jgi:CelD/BcsL family acetyltransferase involved in cellulose biosynthesis
MEAFFDMHAAQWSQRGRGGHFGDWPGARRFHRDLARSLAASNRLRLMQLFADGRVVARQYAALSAGTLSCRFAARLTGDAWRPAGLGQVSLWKLITGAIGEGAVAADFGCGPSAYKRRLGGREHAVRSLVVTADRRSSRRRTRIAGMLADGLDTAYYRLWFRRIAPRIRSVARPLAERWIQSQF